MENETTATPIGDKKGISGRTKLLLLGVVVVLYSLSFGPAMRMKAAGDFKNHRRTSQLLSIFYSPIIWAHNQTPLKSPIEAYVSLWLPAQKDK